jgi:hypothetical protein
MTNILENGEKRLVEDWRGRPLNAVSSGNPYYRGSSITAAPPVEPKYFGRDVRFFPF